MRDNDWISLSTEFKADIRWFVQYAAYSNGIYLFSSQKQEVHIECDTSLFGGGGVALPYCYTWPYPQHHMGKYSDIHQLEALNILVAYQTLAIQQQINPAKIIIWTNNMASSWVLSTGKTKDNTLAACARQIWFLAASNSHEIEIKHKKGSDIPLADALSRMSKDPIKARLVSQAVASQGLVFLTPVINDYKFFNSTL